MTDPDEPRYSIAAASRLSGVSRERIRIWERRYAAVTPGRDAANHRTYSRDDIHRLSLIRALADGGETLSRVASLSTAELETRAGQHALAPERRVTAAETALVVGGGGLDLAEWLRRQGVAEVATTPDIGSAQLALAGRATSLVVVDMPHLHATDLPPVIRLRRRHPGRLLLVFRFAAEQHLAQLRAAGVQPVKAPLQIDDLERQGPGSMAPEPDITERHFSPAELRNVEATADRIKCECPRHLVGLIRDLNAFEDYSLSCETTSTADAARHREIAAVVARARRLVEQALMVAAREEA